MTDFTKYIIARWAYSIGQPIMDDATYNILDKAMRVQFPDNPYCNRSWSSDPCPTELLKQNGYGEMIKAVVLSDKTESIPSLNSDFDIRMEYERMHTTHSVSYKEDGWNVQASYYNNELVTVQTRGRSCDALDASCLSELIPKRIPESGKVLVTMECTIPDSEFKLFMQRYGVTSQRGAVSTALANPHWSLPHICVHAHGVRMHKAVEDKFELLKSWGFQVPMYAWVSTYSELMGQLVAFSNYKDQYGIPTDGVVVEGNHTRALRVKAWEEPVYRSYIQRYEESYGPHSISIQCLIHPIKLPNSVQSRLPATNLRRIVDLNLRPGAPIAFRIASSAIADIDEVATQLLHKEWEGKWEEYQYRIRMNEALKYNM